MTEVPEPPEDRRIIREGDKPKPHEWMIVILLVVIMAMTTVIFKQNLDYDIMKRERNYLWTRFEDYKNDQMCATVRPWFETYPDIKAPYLRELCGVDE